MKKLVLFVALIMVGAPVEAMPSYNPEESADRILNARDSNQDGVISVAEYENLALAKFHKADSDGDGALSAEEAYNTRYKHRPEMMKKSQKVKDIIIKHLMKRWDANGDLQISEAEQMEPVRNEFMRIDRDLDKAITRDELISFWGRKQAELKKSQDAASSGD